MAATQPVRSKRRKTSAASSRPRPRASAPKNRPRARSWRPASAFRLFLRVVLPVSAILFLNVSQRALIAQTSMDIEGLKSRIHQEQTLQENLRLERAKLGSPERIKNIALAKLKMIEAKTVSYLNLGRPSSVGRLMDQDGNEAPRE